MIEMENLADKDEPLKTALKLDTSNLDITIFKNANSTADTPLEKYKGSIN